MTVLEYWKVVRHRWVLLVACALIAAAVAWLTTPASGDTTRNVGSYTATATVLAGPRAGEQGSASQFETISLGRVALFITVGEVPVRAARVLGYTGDPALLASGLTVDTKKGSQAVTIAASASDGDRAAEVANAFTDEAVRYFDEGHVGTGNISLTVLQRATPIPKETNAFITIPSSRPVRAGLAALLGLLIGFGIALVLDRLDSRLRTRQEVHDALGMPVVAEVPRLKRVHRIAGKLPVVEEPLGEYANGYRSARTALMHIPGQKMPGEWTPKGSVITDENEVALTPARVILVSSAFESEGKTTSVANLAASFAETGRRVLVLDADLRSPDAHNQFDVPQGAGISDFLTGTAGTSIEPLLRPTSVRGVQIVTAGTRLDHPAALASRMAPLIEQARHLAEVVIVDSPPLLAASDVFDVLPLVDTVLLVVRSGRLTEPAGNRVAELLGRFQVPVTGIVLLSAPVRRSEGHVTRYGYGYGYGYGEDPRKKERKAAAWFQALKPASAEPEQGADPESGSSKPAFSESAFPESVSSESGSSESRPRQRSE